MKIVYSTVCGGGFYINPELLEALGRDKWSSSVEDDDRTNPAVIKAVEEKWAGTSELSVAEIPDDTDYIITEYDGWETIYYIAYNEKGKPYIKEYEG